MFRALLGLGLTALFSLSAYAQSIPLAIDANEHGWVLNESVSDEFNGDTIDSDKWFVLGTNGDYRNRWKGRAPSQYVAENVSVGDGFLTITTKWDPEFAFSNQPLIGVPYGKPIPITTGCVISNAKFKYGFLEMRCKAADGPVSSSFWTTGEGGELDVFEHFGQKPNDNYASRRYHTSFHDWRKGSPTMGKRIWTNDHTLDFRVADDFHVYGMQWSPEAIKIYVDGQLIRCATKDEIGDNWIASNEQMVWIDSELFPWEVNSNVLKKEDFADGRKFVVDYCRIWQKADPSGECERATNLVGNPGFETGMRGWTGGAEITDDAHSGKAAAGLSKGGRIEQIVNVQPNTTYVLSAWAKCPETNMKDRWLNAFLGVENHGGPRVDTDYFMPDHTRKSLQFKTGPSVKNVTIFFTNQPQAAATVVDDFELIEAPAARR